MQCFFGGPSVGKEYWQEENAMLQRMLLQVQREKMGLQEELHNERVKVAVLEQEIAQIANAAHEMETNLAEYFSSNNSAGRAADTHSKDLDQIARPGLHFQGSPYDPAGAMQLQRIPEQARKQQGVLDVADHLRGFAANLQQRLASISASNTPTAAQAATAAAAGPFAGPPPAQAAAGGAASPFCKVPSRAHSTSVPSEAQGSMDLPMQALAVSRLALQLHHPQATAAEDTSLYSSTSGRKSSCTVLGGSVDLASSINSLRSLLVSQQSVSTGMQEALPEGGGAPHFIHPSQAGRSAAARCAVTRGAAAIASQCATIAAAAAATAAASAARKAAAANAMNDRHQERMERRASTESGFSSLTSPGDSDAVSGGLPAGLYQRQDWLQAQHDVQQQQPQHYPQHYPQQQPQQQFTTNPLWAPSPVEEEGPETDSNGSGSRPSSTEPCEDQRAPCHTTDAAAATAGQEAHAAASSSGSGSAPASADPTPEPAGAQQQAADVLPKLPAVPAHLVAAPQHTQETAAHPQQQPAAHQQHRMQPVALMQLQLQPQQHHGSPSRAHQQHQHPHGGPHFRYATGQQGSYLTSPDQALSARSCSSAAAGPLTAQHHHLAAVQSLFGRPAQLQLQHTLTPVRPAARPSGAGPLHRNLASLSGSLSGALRAAGAGASGGAAAAHHQHHYTFSAGPGSLRM